MSAFTPGDTPDHVRFPTIHCPFCRHPLDATTTSSVATVTPQSGDFSLCIDCGRVAVFVVTTFMVALRRPTPAEQTVIDTEHASEKSAWKAVQAALRATEGWA